MTSKSRFYPVAVALFGGALLLQACDSGTAPEPETITPGTLQAGAVEAEGSVGVALATSPSVTLKDTRGRPMAGATVTFTVSAGGGTIARSSALTDAAGTASAGEWVLGSRPGVNTLTASASGVTAVSFTVTGRVGQATSLTALAANPAGGTVGLVLAPSPGVQLRDRFDNPVAGQTVSFTVLAGSGALASNSAVTDASGTATVSGWTLGAQAGAQTLRASVAGLTADIIVTARAGAASSMQVVAGDQQSGTVGTLLGVRPSVLVRDGFGNAVAGASVQFNVLGGGGSVTGASVVSGNDGIATVGGWTLGTVTGANTLSASLTGVTPVMFNALATPGAAVKLEKVEGDAQTGTAGSALSISPAVRVRDSYDNAVPNVSIAFAVSSGSIEKASVLTGTDGIARAGAWRLGSGTGAQTLTATTAALSATFTATSVPGVPASLQVAAGDAQVANAGTAVSIRPAVRVRDAAGNAVAGVSVQFAVTGGAGTVSGAAATNDASGIATVGGWTLGAIVGPNTLTATVSGVGSVSFTATGTVGAAARIEKVTGDGQSAAVGALVGIRPTVRVLDAFGNRVQGRTVTFTVSGGMGSITGGTQTTAADGTASVGSWTLGAEAGTNTLTASVSGVGNVTFTATATAVVVPPATYHIDVRFLTSMSATQQAAFTNAAARWERVIVGDIPDSFVNAAASACGVNHPALNETVDDLLILVEVVAIDGPGKVLGSAGPCMIRNSGYLTAVGSMRLDVDDLTSMETRGTLEDVILHEMGHVLGIGTLWNYFSLLQAGGTADPFYAGAGAKSSFTLAGGSILPGNGVPVEGNTAPVGTRDSHWRESTMRNELMTGWISSPGNPLSSVTVSSLADMGYTVNPFAADSYAVTILSGYALREPGQMLVEQALPAPRFVH